MKIGICGGTFDPFHRGHLDPVLAVRDAMQWSSVLYIPAFVQPFKTERSTASGHDRFAMAVLATEGHDDLFVSNWELERQSVSYTVDTLTMLRAAHADATIDWIIGDDNLAQLGEWNRIDRIFDLANFLVLSRLGSHPAVPAPFRGRVVGAGARNTHGGIVIAQNKEVTVSSTEIRRKIRAGESIAGLVDPRVSRYIHHNRLYREAQ